MNKKIIALAVALAASCAANAGTIYEKNDTEVKLKGEIDAYLSSQSSEAADGTETDYDADIDLWAKIQLDAKHQLNEDASVFGSFELENGNGFGPGDDQENEVKTDDLYLGAMFNDSFGFAVGEIGDFGDSLDAITIDNTNEGYGYMDDFATSFESKGHAISFKFDADGLKLIGDMYMAEDEDTDAAYGVSASYTAAGVSVGASYQDHGNRDGYTSTNNGDNDIYGFKAGYAANGFSVAAHYVVEQINSEDYEAIGLAADYEMGAARLYVSGFTSEKDNASASEDDMTALTVGAEYGFSKNLIGFVEYSSLENSDYEDGAEDNLALLGTYFKF